MTSDITGLYVPMVTEITHRGETRHDIWSRLLVDRIVFLGTQINDQVANLIIAQLLFLESQDPEKDIFLYINSPGGVVTAGMAIYDTMNYIRPDVSTICIGQAASMGAVLLAGGAAGKRRALPHARVMIHQPLGGFKVSTDIEIHAKEICVGRRPQRHAGTPHRKKPSRSKGHRARPLPHGRGGGRHLDEVIPRTPAASDEQKGGSNDKDKAQEGQSPVLFVLGKSQKDVRSSSLGRPCTSG